MEINVSKMLRNMESADGDVPADAWVTAIIKVSCVLIIGVVILNAVFVASNITACSPFAGLMTSVEFNVNNGYTLAALMVLVIGAAAMMTFFGFM
jgi:hypothetical protein